MRGPGRPPRYRAISLRWGAGVRALCPRRGGHLPSSARDVGIPRNLRHLPETGPHGTCAPLMLCSALPVASFTGTPDARRRPRRLLALALGFGFIHLLWSRPAPCTIYLLSLSLSGNKSPGAGIVPGAPLWTDHRPRLDQAPGGMRPRHRPRLWATPWRVPLHNPERPAPHRANVTVTSHARCHTLWMYPYI